MVFDLFMHPENTDALAIVCRGHVTVFYVCYLWLAFDPKCPASWEELEYIGFSSQSLSINIHTAVHGSVFQLQNTGVALIVGMCAYFW